MTAGRVIRTGTLVRQAPRAVARPAVVEAAGGRKTSGMRIGAAAHHLVAGTRIPLTWGGGQCLRPVT